MCKRTTASINCEIYLDLKAKTPIIAIYGAYMIEDLLSALQNVG